MCKCCKCKGRCKCLVRMCNCFSTCFNCGCGFCVHPENRRRLIVELVMRAAALACAAQCVAILSQMLFFASCFNGKGLIRFRSPAFGDCDYPMPQILQIFFIPHFSLCVLCVFGILRHNYAFILPHLSVAGVYTLYCSFCQIAEADEDTIPEFFMDNLVTLTEIMYCFLIMKAFFQARIEANIPPPTKIDMY